MKTATKNSLKAFFHTIQTRKPLNTESLFLAVIQETYLTVSQEYIFCPNKS